MTVARTLAVALTGLTGQIVEVEAAVSSQLPGIAVIGLPDTALAEAKQRIRVACQNSGFTLSRRFITLNLSPAELPKNGSGFDLGMALAALVVSGEVPQTQMADTMHIGELGLDGAVRRTAGTLPAVQAARQAGINRVMVPFDSVAEAQLIPDIEVIGVRTLCEAAAWHRGEKVAAGQRDHQVEADTETSDFHESDMSHVLGHEHAVDALAVAAVGGHHTSLLGPPGTGKTMLASRIPSIMPELDDEEAIEVTAIASLSGSSEIRQLMRTPPFESPHHSITLSAMVGGGTRMVKPGVITRSSGGVLFLDEAPEFTPSVLDALRQPLESGTISVHRTRFAVTLPAKFMLVLAANPCPCGNSGIATLQCSCSGSDRRRYATRLSGPLNDRIDIRLNIHRTNPLLSDRCSSPTPRSSAELRAQVSAARQRTRHRLRDTPWRLNGQVPGAWLRSGENRLAAAVTSALDSAFEKGRLSMRGYDRVLRVAWSIADFEGEARPTRSHVARALSLRAGTTQ